MSLSLEKGQRVDLTKGTGIKKIFVGLGWDVNQGTGAAFDLDAAAYALAANDKLATMSDVVYFNKLKHSSGSIIHMGDNLTGVGEGDDEVINVDLEKVPATVQNIVFAVNIYKASERKQNFGMVKNAFIRVVDAETKTEYLKYDLAEDYSTSDAVLVGEIYRKDNEWKFAARGEGTKGDLNEIAKKFQ